jgi:hypothetical protein
LLSIALFHFEKDKKHGYSNSSGLRLYLVVMKKEMKSIDLEYQLQVGYWASNNHL